MDLRLIRWTTGDDDPGDRGEDFIQKLVKAVDEKYNTVPNGELQHDITPLVESIAGDSDVNTLTRRQIKTCIDEKIRKA